MHKNANTGAASAAVNIISSTTFTLKKRPAIAPAGLQNVKWESAINQASTEGKDVNEVHVNVIAEGPQGQFRLTKKYNVKGRGSRAFLEDYNAWAGTGLTEDDLFNTFDGLKDKDQPLVVDVGHRKVGKNWEAFIKAFHPAGYIGEQQAA